MAFTPTPALLTGRLLKEVFSTSNKVKNLSFEITRFFGSE